MELREAEDAELQNFCDFADAWHCLNCKDSQESHILTCTSLLVGKNEKENNKKKERWLPFSEFGQHLSIWLFVVVAFSYSGCLYCRRLVRIFFRSKDYLIFYSISLFYLFISPYFIGGICHYIRRMRSSVNEQYIKLQKRARERRNKTSLIYRIQARVRWWFR